MNKMILIAIAVVIVLMLVVAAVFITTQSPENASPTAVIDSPGNNLNFSEDTEIEFDAGSSSDPDKDDLSFYWNSNISGDFGDEQRFTTKLEPGFHEIKLTVVDKDSAQNSTVAYIAVYPSPFTEINSPIDDRDYYSSELIIFNGSSCSSTYSSNLNYTWKSSLDGMLGFNEILTANLTTGSHIITLEVEDGLGTAQDQKIINVGTNQFPTAKIKSPKYDDVFLIDTDIYFDGSYSRDPDDHELFFNWTSNLDGKIGFQETFYTNLSAGTHIIELEVNDGVGGFGETSLVVSVNSHPIADAGLNRSVETGEAVTFDGAGSVDPDGDTLIYTWDFGDGNKDVGESVIHIYNKEGNFTVKLTVNDGKGGFDSDSIVVEVIYIFHGTGVYGHVYDSENSEPVEDVELVVYGYDEVKDEFFFDDTYTDISGYYEFHTPEGDFWLDARKEGYYNYDEDITIPKDQGVELDIYLQKVPPETAKIYGYVYDNETLEPLDFADIDIYNDEGHHNWTYTDSNGYYEMNAPPGDYTLECWAWDWEDEIEYEDYYTEISLSDKQQLRLDIYLKRTRPSDNNITLEFSTWDMMTMTQKTIEYSNTYWTRTSMDSDDDGSVSEAEVTAYEIMMESMFEYFNEDFNTQNIFLVDDINYLYIENSADVQIEGAVGPTTSTDPITTTTTLDLRSNQTIPSADTHEIRLNATYDDSWGNYTFHVLLPSLFEMTNYTASEDVNVTGKSEITIETYEDPNPDDEIYSEWVILDVERTI